MCNFSSWDEWVAEDRVLKYNDANCQRQTELRKQHDALDKKNKKGKSVIFQYLFLLYFHCITSFSIFTVISATVSKPKKPESNQSDSRASTPSKETLPPEKSSPAPHVSSSSRSRTQKQTTTTAAAAAVATASPAATTTSTTHTSQETTNRESLKRGQNDTGRDDAK